MKKIQSLAALLCVTFVFISNVSADINSYIIGPGDILSVSVWKEPDMQKEVQVRPDGVITFPLVGDVAATGKTVIELKHVLEEKLKVFIPDVVLTVSVLRAASNKIYVLGKVSRPGEYVAANYMDVLQALTLAGGLTPYADSDDIKIIRRDSDNKKFIFTFDYDEVITGERLDMNIMLKPGDTVVVP